jgi:hypothetical protein
MNRKQFPRLIALLAFAGGVTISGCTSATSAPGTTAQRESQVLPVAENPIENHATAKGIAITAAVENNVDPATKQDISDRLQINIENMSPKRLSDLEVFYEMTDATTGKSEAYYQKLNDFSLAPGEVGTVFFDNEAGKSHFPENEFSIYRTSENAVKFSIQVSAPAYRPAVTEAKKEAGTDEEAD